MRKLIFILFIFTVVNSGFGQNDSIEEIDDIILITPVIPSFPGGDAKLFSFLKLVLNYPEIENKTKEKVYLEFLVRKNGELDNFKILRSSDTLFSQEAIRIINLMPRWNPGKDFSGKKTDVKLVLPIIFKANKEEIFQVLETQPSFPGGDVKLFEFLAKTIKYPEFDRQNGIRSKFYFEFIVEKDGSLSNLKLLKNESSEFYKSVALAFNEMPKWNPGLQNGKSVRTKIVLPLNITFR